MGLTIPNDTAAGVNAASYEDQARPDKVDIDIIVAASSATGVTSGCAVTAQGSPNMTVAVASGTVMVAGAAVAVTGANVTITAAAATNPRIDLVVVNNAGTLSATAGTAAAIPCMPNIPASSVVLAMVYVPANITTIDSTRITDKRMGVSFDTTVPVTQAFSDAAATGSAAFAARRDHVHGMPTAFGLSIFGDGSDGTQTFDGSTTILSLGPSSGVYTLARDLFLAAGTINNGVTIITNGYRIFCAGTLTNNGTIQWNGNAASGSAAGAEVSNSLGSMHRGSSTTAPGTAGGAGGTGAGSAGSNNANGSTMGARGGSGGLGPSGAGGAAGTVITPGGANLLPRQGVSGVLFQFVIPGAAGAIGILSAIQGGSGGGGGGGDSTHAGGGGGGGGGLVAVYSKTVVGTGAIQARGGNGANGSSGNAGGGGGGGGGFVLVISSSASAGAISGQTIDSNGGTKGTKVGTGVDGSNGSNGSTVVLAA